MQHYACYRVFVGDASFVGSVGPSALPCKVWATKGELKNGRRIDFFDAGPSMSRTLGKKVSSSFVGGISLKDPWMSSIPTLTTKAKIVMRTVWPLEPGMSSPRIHIRALADWELLQIAGWDLMHSEYKYLNKTFDDALLTNIAGNAFSGFSCLAVLTTALACYGLLKDNDGPSSSSKVVCEIPEEAAVVFSSSESTDSSDSD